MISQLKSLIHRLIATKKRRFRKITKRIGRELDYALNEDSVNLAYDILMKEEYIDFFPISKNKTIVDIGAHFGFFTLFAHLKGEGSHKVFAYEASKPNFNVLMQNLEFINSDRILRNCVPVLGKEEYVEVKEHNNSWNAHIAKGERTDSSIKATTLEAIVRDNNIKNIDFLKLDCEGSEYEIILESPDEVFTKISTISMEYHDRREEGYEVQMLINRLKALDFTLVKKTQDIDHSKSGLIFGKLIMTRITNT